MILSEGVPRRRPPGLGLLRNQDLGAWVGQEEQIPRVQSQHLGEFDHDLFRGMPLSRLEMANIRDRRSDPARHFLLGQVELPAAFTDDRTKTSSYILCHVLLFSF